MHNFVCKYRHVLIKSPIILQGCSRYGVRENEFGAGNAVLMTGFYIYVSPLQSINNPMLLLVYIWFDGLTLSEKKWFVNMSTFGQVKICLCVRMPLWAGEERKRFRLPIARCPSLVLRSIICLLDMVTLHLGLILASCMSGLKQHNRNKWTNEMDDSLM